MDWKRYNEARSMELAQLRRKAELRRDDRLRAQYHEACMERTYTRRTMVFIAGMLAVAYVIGQYFGN